MLSRWSKYNIAYHLLGNILIWTILIGMFRVTQNVPLMFFTWCFLMYAEFKISTYLFVKNNFFD